MKVEKLINDFLQEEEGVSTLEIAIICAALLAIALVFRKTIINYCKKLAENVLGK